MSRRSGGGSRAIRGGVLADGCFKLVLAAAYAFFAAPLGAWLGAPNWLVVVTALGLAVSGIAEILASNRLERRHVLLLAAYDITWLVISIVALTVASQGVSGSGPVWLVYQVVGSAALAVLFSIHRSRPLPPRAQPH